MATERFSREKKEAIGQGRNQARSRKDRKKRKKRLAWEAVVRPQGNSKGRRVQEDERSRFKEDSMLKRRRREAEKRVRGTVHCAESVPL